MWNLVGDEVALGAFARSGSPRNHNIERFVGDGLHVCVCDGELLIELNKMKDKSKNEDTNERMGNSGVWSERRSKARMAAMALWKIAKSTLSPFAFRWSGQTK